MLSLGQAFFSGIISLVPRLTNCILARSFLSIDVCKMPEIEKVSICIYYMTNSYRPDIKKFDWFKAGL